MIAWQRENADIERIIQEICIITPRTYTDTTRAFKGYLSTQPYSAADLAHICRSQALADAPMPWEPDYEQSVLEDLLKNSL